MIRALAGEQVPKQWDVRESRPAVQRFGVDALEEAAENTGFAFFQANVVLNFALADDRLLDTTDGGASGHGGDFYRNLQANLMVGMDARGDVCINADVDVLELCVHEGIDADGASSLEAAGGDGDAVADAHLCGLTIDGWQFRILNDAGCAVGHKRVDGRSGQSNLVISPGKELFKRDAARVGGRRGGGVGIYEGDRGGALRHNPQLMDPITACLEDLHLYDDFGLRIVQFMDDFFGDCELIGCVADEDRVLRVHLLNALEVKQLSQTSDDLGHVLRKGRVGQIERLHDLFLIIAPLLWLVRSDQDDVLRYRLPEGFRLE